MSYNQPGPYGGQQPQQPGPYGQQPQAPQPGYGYPQQAPQGVPPQQPPYGQQPHAPYGQAPQPPMPPQGGGGGGKKAAAVIGAIAVVAAIGVGGYFLLGKDDGGSSVADDGKTYKLTTPSTVAGEYQKETTSSGSGGMGKKDLAEMEQAGVANPKDVSSAYQSGSGNTQKSLNFGGVYGDIDDPEKVVDAMFAKMKKNASKSDAEGVKLIGEPEEFKPAGFENGIMKCQAAEFRLGAADDAEKKDGIPNSFQTPMCVWGDHSTAAFVTHADGGATLSGKKLTLDETAALTAKLRDDVRVEVK
ncbi:hypothetical protein [Streptomyces sp. NPDC059009]|uniref:hypothetical protein n=1 Tax=Streptomyces sp. NPDC059009 TaxID=3346694 RepID=UPI0036C612BC